MSAPHAVELALKPPSRGWLPFRLALAGSVIEDAASNVLNDPLASLFDLASCIAGGGPLPSRAFLWLEPDAYALEAAAAGQDGVLIVRVLYGRHAVPQMGHEGMTVRAETAVPKAVVLDALLSGLADLLRDPGAQALNRWYDGESIATYQARLSMLRTSKR